MTEQEKREKVIKGLECCVPMTERNGVGDCHNCPYDRKITLEGGVTECCHNLMTDALALLKAQEPRVMTLEEARIALHNDIVVWLELKDMLLAAGVRMDGTDYFTMQNDDVLDETDLDSDKYAELYGKRVRCWTSRPTDAQREAVKWE